MLGSKGRESISTIRVVAIIIIIIIRETEAGLYGLYPHVQFNVI